MRKDLRIHNRFNYWSIADCKCEYCINYQGKKKPCRLDVCCVENIKQEAVRREKGGDFQ